MLRPGKSANGGGLPAYGSPSYGAGGNNNNNNGAGYGGYGGGGSSYGGYGSSGSFGAASGGAGGYDGGGYGSSPSAARQQVSYGRSRRGSGGGKSSSIPWMSILQNPLFWAGFFCFFACLMAFSYRSSSISMMKELGVNSVKDAVGKLKSLQRDARDKQRFQRESQTANERQRSYKDEVRSLDRENRDLKRRTAELTKKVEEAEKKAATSSAPSSSGIPEAEQKRLLAREDAWKSQVYLLQNATQREARREVKERFGPGPHHIKVTVKLPTGEEPPEETEEMPTTEESFTMELAPIELMPHAVHRFLEQVHHRLWDGTFFYLNGPHVLQAGPQDYDYEEDSEAIDDEKKKQFEQLKRFQQYNLAELSFPEYHVDWPHIPWSIGFTGRPGGPDWYINKVDNTEGHGPGGQSQHVLGDEQADPCFAKVVEGKETLEKLYKGEVYAADSDYAYFLMEPVEIKEAVLTEKPPPALNFTSNAINRKKKKKRKNRTVNKEHVPPTP